MCTDSVNTTFAHLSQLKNRRQPCVCFDSKVSQLNLAGEPDVYSLLLQNLWFETVRLFDYNLILEVLDGDVLLPELELVVGPGDDLALHNGTSVGIQLYFQIRD